MARLTTTSSHVSINNDPAPSCHAAMQVNILEARNHLSRLIKAAQAGEDVVIANRGEPVARIVAAHPPAESPALGDPAEILAWLRDHPPPIRTRRTREQIDADIQVERDSWD